MKHVRAGIVLAALGFLGWLGGCSDSPGPCTDCPPPPPSGVIVSNPIPTPASASAASTAFRTGDEVVYVSMTAGTAPSGKVATIRRVGDAFPVTVPVMDGAVDPVQVAAQTGDSIDVVVLDIGGQTVLQMRVGVTSARPPVVVRTDPPRKKTDVPVNAALVVVFSEPVAAASLNTASVQLRVGQSVVSGAVRFLDSTLDATHVTAEFVHIGRILTHRDAGRAGSRWRCVSGARHDDILHWY